MPLRHLTDREIQAHLQGSGSSNKPWVASHLTNCDDCREQIKQYQALFEELQQEHGFNLPPNFATAVATRIQNQSSPSARTASATIFLALLGLVVGMGTLFYFIDLKPLSHGFSRLKELKYFWLELFSTISHFLAGLNLDWSLFGFAIVILMVISAIDHFMIQSRQKFIS